jgi:hypothetical protein
VTAETITTLPANPDAERTILGGILLDNAAHTEAVELGLTADAFSLDSHRRIFLCMSELIGAGSEADLVTLAEILAKHKEVEAVGGVAYLASLTEGLPRRPAISAYIRIIKDKSMLRRIMGICSAAITKAEDQSQDATGVIDETESQLLELRKDGGATAGDWRGMFHSVSEFESAPPLTFAIDEIMQEDGITLVGGLPASGKTMFMLAMARALLDGLPLFNYFGVPRTSDRVIYLIPESSLGPFVARLHLFRLETHIRADRFLFLTLSAKEQVALTDRRLLQACEGATVFLDTCTRFLDGPENDAETSRAFARNLFSLIGAGARTLCGAHHSPKAFEGQDRMTLESVLRGSGDLGAMISTCWGLRQIDPVTNRIYVENVKPRDFLPPKPFIIQGRPSLDKDGYFELVAKPGAAGELRDHLNRNKAGAPALSSVKALDAIKMRLQGKTIREIASELGVSKSWVGRLSTNSVHGDNAVDNAEPDGEDDLKESLPPSGGNGLSQNSFLLGFRDRDSPNIGVRETEPESTQSAPDIPLTSKEGPSKKRKRPTAKRKAPPAKDDPKFADVKARVVAKLRDLNVPKTEAVSIQ